MGARGAACSHVIKRLLNPTTNGGVAIRNARGAEQRACNAERPFFYRRCVVVVTQAEADFRFGLSPEGAQARGEAAARWPRQKERGAVASVSGETKNFATPSSSI